MPSLGVSSLDLGRTGLPPALFFWVEETLGRTKPILPHCSNTVPASRQWRAGCRYFAYQKAAHAIFACPHCIAGCRFWLPFAALHPRYCSAERERHSPLVPSLGVSSLDLGRRQCRRPFFLPVLRFTQQRRPRAAGWRNSRPGSQPAPSAQLARVQSRRSASHSSHR